MTAVTRLPYISLDITCLSSVKKTIGSVKPDVVFHCAAWTVADLAEDDENMEKVRAVNATGIQNIANASKGIGCKMIDISTDYVFEGQGTEPWKADCKDYAPMNVYGQTKLEGELDASETLEKYFVERIA